MCSSPKLFAAYHVFHRLSVPRHPPCALLCLTSLVPALSLRKRRLPPVRASVRGGRLHALACAFFFRFRLSRLPEPELAFVLGESACPYLYIRTFRILDVVFSWNLIKKTFYYVQFSRYIFRFRPKAFPFFPKSLLGTGLKWTRTTDLTLIRRAL